MRRRGVEDVRIPAGAECGQLSVPVDYAKPDGDVAHLAMIRFKATGDKIGSLIINPGGPGESGVEAAASVVAKPAALDPRALRPRRLRPARGGSSTPAVWCNSDADNDRRAPTRRSTTAPRASPTSRHETKDFVQRCVDKMGKEFLANVGTASVVKDLDAMRAALGDDKLTYLGYSYGTRIGSAYAEAYPQNVRAMILDGAVDPNADPMEADIGQAAAFQKAFNDYAADCAKSLGLPAGHRPGQGRRRSTTAWSTRWWQKPATDQGSARAELRRRDRRHHPAAVLADPVAAPDRRPDRAADGHGDTMLALADMYMRPRRSRATTTTRPTSGSRSTASTSRRSPTAPRSSRRTAAAARSHRS